jgi:hypothetical protein
VTPVHFESQALRLERVGPSRIFCGNASLFCVPLLLQCIKQATILIGDLVEQLGDFQMHAFDLGVLCLVHPLLVATP